MATAIKEGVRGLGLIVQINADRLVAMLVLGGAIYLAAYVNSL